MISADSTNKIDFIEQINLAIKHGDFREADALVDQLCEAQGFDIEYPMPDSFISELKKKEQYTMRKNTRKHKWQKRIAIWAIIIAAIGAGGFTVYAVVENLAKQRMEEMSKEEKEVILEDVDKSKVESVTQSREFTEAETARMIELAVAYKEGQFPEDAVKHVDDESQIDKDVLCYVTTIKYFYLPERELTDEELLQFIDEKNKTDYVLEERAEETYADELKSQEEERERIYQENQENGGISEEESLAIAKEYRTKLLGESGEEITEELKQRLISRGREHIFLDGTTQLTLTSYIYDHSFFPEGSAEAGPYQEPVYTVYYYAGQIPLYLFHVNAQDGTVFYVYINDGYTSEEEVSIQEAEENIPVMCEKAEEYLQNLAGVSKEDLEEISCHYYKNEGGTGVSYNTMTFWFTNKEGVTYKIGFDCKNLEFKEYGIESYETYLKNNSPERLPIVTKIK